MNSIIEKIITIANNLDDKGNETIASALDSLAEKLTDIKIAQYVGSQGYWVRNSRCWANCYRQKRANNPDMPAQKVWTSCHEEYVTAMQNQNLGKSTSSWDKYASSDPKNVIAALDAKFNENLSSLIEKNIESGMDRGNAIFAAIDDIEMQPYDDLIEASQKAFELASNMFEKSPREAVKIAQAGEDLVKEAQWWQRRMNDLKSPGRGLRQMWDPAVMDSKSQGDLLNSINRLQGAMKTILQERANLSHIANQSGLNQIAQQINTQLPDSSLLQISEGITGIGQFAQSVIDRTTGGEKGNAFQRGMNWLNQQGQQGADKAKQSAEFWSQQGQQGQQGDQYYPDRANSYQNQGIYGPSMDGSFQKMRVDGPGMSRGTSVNSVNEPMSPYMSPYNSNVITPGTYDSSGRMYDPAEAKPQNNKQQNQIYDDPALNDHSYIVPKILQSAPNVSALNDLFRPYLDKNRRQAQSNSFKTPITKVDNNNFEGELLKSIKEYLNELDKKNPEQIGRLYEALKKNISRNNDIQSELFPEKASYSSQSSIKKHVRSSTGKTFNLAKFNDRGDR